MPKIEFRDFYNDGFGWICRRCESELKSLESPTQTESHARFMREGEAESKNPQLSNSALAKWTNKTQTALICPRCGITELAAL